MTFVIQNIDHRPIIHTRIISDLITLALYQSLKFVMGIV